MLKISCLSSTIFCLFLVACQANDPFLSLSKKTLDPPPRPATSCATDSHDAVTPTRDPQTPALYAILVADTCDRNIGDSVNRDIQNMEKLLDTIATQTHLQLIKKIVKGDQLSYQQITQAVNQLSVQPNDVVIFYYSGHGVRSSDKQTQWPSLCVEGVGYCIYEDKRLDLDWVIKVVKDQKQPRLFIALADACNNVVNFRPPQPPTYRSTNPDQINQLFLKSQGHIIASGSIPGEVSYGTELGGYFTNAWLKSLRESFSSPADWYSIMETATQPLPVPGENRQQHPQKEVQVWPVEKVEDKTVLEVDNTKTIVPPPPPPPPPAPVISLPPTTLTISPSPPLSPGQAMQVQVRTAIDGYLLLYDADRTQSQQIFPNAMTSQKGLKEFRVRANHDITIPDPEIYELDFQLMPPNMGKRFLIALVATDLTQLTQMQSLLPPTINQVMTTLTTTTEVTQALSQWLQKSGNVTGSGWSVGVVEYEVK